MSFLWLVYLLLKRGGETSSKFANFIIFAKRSNSRWSVEKRKISYFGLERKLIQHWISPIQDDLSYSARTFISG